MAPQKSHVKIQQAKMRFEEDSDDTNSMASGSSAEVDIFEDEIAQEYPDDKNVYTIALSDENDEDLDEEFEEATPLTNSKIEMNEPNRKFHPSNSNITRGLVLNKNGEIFNDVLTPYDIVNGAVKYLTVNHVAISQLTHGIVAAIPELYNQKIVKAMANSMAVRINEKSDTISRMPLVQMETLHYIFDLKPMPNPEIDVFLDRIDGNFDISCVLSEDQIVQLIHLSAKERHEKAPYAWQQNGGIFADYRDALREYIVTARLSRDIWDTAIRREFREKPWSRSKVLRIRDRRFQELADSNWEIALVPRKIYRSKLRCDRCQALIFYVDRKHHLDSMHSELEMNFSVFHDEPDRSNTLQLKKADEEQKKYVFKLSVNDFPQKDVVIEIGQEILSFYLRWSRPFEENSKASVLALACERVRQRQIANGKDPKLASPIIYLQPLYLAPRELTDNTGVTSVMREIAIEIPLFLPETLEPHTVHPRLLPSNISPFIPTPQLPDHIVWTFRQRARTFCERINEPNSDPCVNATIAILKYISVQMSGKVVDHAGANALVAYYLALLQRAPLTTENFFHRRSLFVVSLRSAEGYSYISPTKRLYSLVHGRLPRICIQSLDRLHIVSVLDKGKDGFQLCGNAIDTWKALARAADDLNEQLQDGSNISIKACRCSENEKNTVYHHCPHCFRLEVCVELATHAAFEVERICRLCIMKYGRHRKRTVAQNLKDSLRHHLRREILGYPKLYTPKELVQLRTSTIDHLSYPTQSTKGMWTFVDGYSDGPPITFGRLGLGRQLLQPSHDAIFPFYVCHDFQGDVVTRIHHHENICLTTLGANLGKNASLVGTLHLVAVCYSHTKKDSQSQLSREELHREVMVQADDICRLQTEYPWQMKSRLRAEYSLEDFKKIKADWIVSRPADECEIKNLNAQGTIMHSKFREPEEWEGKPRDWDTRISNIVCEMEKKAGRNIPRSHDGCPFPAHISSMPHSWNFFQCWTFFGFHVRLQWLSCNKLWGQVDTIDTLFLSACLSFLGLARGDFFNLPITLYRRHPFRLSIGHYIHDKPLRSGWMVPFPHSLADFSFADDNMIMETCFTNFFKNNASSEVCEAAREHMLSINLPKEIYNPARLLRPCHRSGPEYAPWSIDGHISGTRMSTSASDVKTDAAPHPEYHGQSMRILNTEGRSWLSSAIQLLFLILPLRQAVEEFSGTFTRHTQLKHLSQRVAMIHELRWIFRSMTLYHATALDCSSLLGLCQAVYNVNESKPISLDQWAPDASVDGIDFLQWMLQELDTLGLFDRDDPVIHQHCRLSISETCQTCLPVVTSTVHKDVPAQLLRTLVFSSARFTSSDLQETEQGPVMFANAFEQVVDLYSSSCGHDRLVGQPKSISRLCFKQLPEYLMFYLDRRLGAAAHPTPISTKVTKHEQLDVSAFCINIDDQQNYVYQLASEIRFTKPQDQQAMFYHTLTDRKQWHDSQKFAAAASDQDMESSLSLVLLYKRTSRQKPTILQGLDGSSGLSMADALKDLIPCELPPPRSSSQLPALGSRARYRADIIELFRRYSLLHPKGMTIRTLLTSIDAECRSMIDFEEWKRALSEVAVRFSGAGLSSIWLLRTMPENDVDMNSRTVFAILNKSKLPDIEDECYLISAIGKNSGEAFVMWEPVQRFRLRHVDGPVRLLIDMFEAAKDDD